MTPLLQRIAGQWTIKHLALSNLRLKLDGLQRLCEYIATSNILEDLDLSHLHFPASTYIKVLQAISRCKKLRSLSIAGNQLIDHNFGRANRGALVEKPAKK